MQATVVDFAKNELLPGVIDRDRDMIFPTEQVKMMGELGFLGMMVDPIYGGGGMDTMSYVLAMEEISKVDNSCSVIMSVNNSLVCWGIEKFGTEAQKLKYLPDLASGRKIGSFCLSEPEAGSDATSQRTTAIDHGDHYVLNGTKNWITNGGSSSVHVVIAQTNPELKHRGINAFIVETDWKGAMAVPLYEMVITKGNIDKAKNGKDILEALNWLTVYNINIKQDYVRRSPIMTRLWRSMRIMNK